MYIITPHHHVKTEMERLENFELAILHTFWKLHD